MSGLFTPSSPRPYEGDATASRLVAVCVLICAMLWSAGAAEAAAKDNMALCRNAAIQAADKHGIPREVMVAITLVETRTKREGQSGPWPWTVNVAGVGRWFDSRAAALIHAQQALAKGQNSFDVGCFQLNYQWHGAKFASIDEMFEPGPSGDYAAGFLKSLHAETGDWIKASGLYHSRTAKHAKRYRGLVARTVKAMGGHVPQQVEVEVAQAAHPGPQILRVGDPTASWPLREGRIRSPRPGATAGSLGLDNLRRSRGTLLGGG